MKGIFVVFFAMIVTSVVWATAPYNIGGFWRGGCRVNTPVNFTWQGGGGSNWSNPSNWVGGSVPGPGDVAVFNCSCAATCEVTIDTDVEVSGFSIQDGFTGTITQGLGHTILVGSVGWTQTSGTFIGSNANITINGPFNLSEGVFTSTSTNLTVGGNFIFNGGTFNHNNGSVLFSKVNAGNNENLSLSFISPLELNHVLFGGGAPGAIDYNYTWTIGSGLTLVTQNLTIQRTSTTGLVSVNGGILQVQGSLAVNAGGNGGSSQIQFIGGQAQTYSIAGGLPLSSHHLVNKSGGTLSLLSHINLNTPGQDFIISGGVVDMSGFNLDVDNQISIGLGSTLRCNNGDYSSAGFVNNGTLDCPQQLAFTIQPSVSGTTWTSLASQPVVSIVSNQGHISNASTHEVSLSAYTDASCSVASAAVLMASTNPLAAVSGISNFLGVSHHLQETIYIGASAPGVANGCSNAVTITMLPYTWTGAAADSNWNSTANWSNNAVPGSSDTATFDMNCGMSCNATANVAVTMRGLDMKPVYNGTITQAADQTITLGANGWIQSAGTFIGSNANINVNADGPVEITNGTFTSTSGVFTFIRNLTIGSTVVFNANSGTIRTIGGSSKTSTISIESAALNIFRIEKTSSTAHVTISGTLSLKDLAINTSGHALNGGFILISGDLEVRGTLGGGSATLRLAGNTPQVIDGISGSRLPNLEIASSGGTVTLVGTVDIERNFTYTSGVVDTLGAVVRFVGGMSMTSTISATGVSFDTLEFLKTSSTAHITISGPILTHHLNTLSTDSISINDGTILVTGNLTSRGSTAGGSALIRIEGSSNQFIDGELNATLPNLEIASTGGTVTLIGTVEVQRDFTYTSGVVDTLASKVRFVGGTAMSSTISAAGMNFDTLEFGKTGSSASITIVGSVATHHLNWDNNQPWFPVNSGVILVTGDIVTSRSSAGGSTLVKIIGSTNQSISGVTNATLPNVEIDSSGGTVTFSGVVSISGDYTYTNGTVDYTLATMNFTKIQDANIDFGPYNPTVLQLSKGASTTNILSPISTDDLIISHSSTAATFNGSNILVYGDVTTSGSSGVGNSVVRIIGNTNQSITGSGGGFNNLEFESTGGTISLFGSFQVRSAGELKMISGTLDPGSSTVTSIGSGTLTISMGTTALNNFIAHRSLNSTTQINGTLKLNGNFEVYSSSGSTYVSGGVVEVSGNMIIGGSGGGSYGVSFVGDKEQTWIRTSGGRPRGLVTVNKTAGTLTLLSNILLDSGGQDVLVQSGTLNLNGFSLSIDDVLTIQPGGTVQCSGGLLTYGSLSNSGTLVCP